MTTVRTPKDEDERKMFDQAVRSGLAIPLDEFIEGILGRTPETELVDAIRLGIESHYDVTGGNIPLDVKNLIIQFAQWQEFAC